jgi:hypothetical protein
MKQRARQRGQIMLIILGTLFVGAGAATGIFTSGKSIQSIRKEIKGLGLDAVRKEQAYGLVDRWEAIADPELQGYQAYAQRLRELMQEQDASRTDFSAVLDRQRAQLEAAEGQLLPLREELRSLLSEDEWNGLFR